MGSAKRSAPFSINGSFSKDTPQKASKRFTSFATSSPPPSIVGSIHARCQMDATLPGLPGCTRIARPRIWLDITKELTYEPSTKVLIAGASQPSPSKAAVPTSICM